MGDSQPRNIKINESGLNEFSMDTEYRVIVALIHLHMASPCPEFGQMQMCYAEIFFVT